MLVPPTVQDLHDSHATLDQPPCQQGAGGKRARSLDLGPVPLERGLRLAGQIDQLGNAGLHPKSHLVLGNPRLDFVIAELSETPGIQFRQCVEHQPAIAPFDAVRILQVQDGIALGADQSAKTQTALKFFSARLKKEGLAG